MRPGTLDLTPKSTIWQLSALAPELAILAAALRLSVDDALAGDTDARAWLAGPRCLEWLAALLPDDAPESSAERVQQQLCRMVGRR